MEQRGGGPERVERLLPGRFHKPHRMDGLLQVGPRQSGHLGGGVEGGDAESPLHEMAAVPAAAAAGIEDVPPRREVRQEAAVRLLHRLVDGRFEKRRGVCGVVGEGGIGHGVSVFAQEYSTALSSAAWEALEKGGTLALQ